MKKPFKIIILSVGIPIIALIIIILAYYLFLFVIYNFNPDFIKIDSCLDEGGTWDYEDKTCKR